jgi:hypothetical protein
MDIIEIKTLIDITNTDVRRINQGTQTELDQFRNWTTLTQCIGMRAIMLYDKDPSSEVVDVKGMGFGSEYKGKHRVWTFQFRTDRQNAFLEKADRVGLLRIDLDKIPVIVKLTETINIQQAVFELLDPKITNTVVKAL